MSAQQPSGGPDWLAPVLAAIATLLTAAGGVWAVVANAGRSKQSEERTDTERTLDGVWDLVEGLQKEREQDKRRIEALEAEVTRLKNRVAELEAELRQARLGGN